MGCVCATATDEYHGWECEITGGACLLLMPNQDACADMYGEVEHTKKWKEKHEEECRAAVEKQTAKKVKSISRVKDGDSYVGLIGRCPCCGDILEEDTVYCDCGQKLDWNTDTVADQEDTEARR